MWRLLEIWFDRRFSAPRRDLAREARRFKLKQQLRASGGRVARTYSGRGVGTDDGTPHRDPELEALWREILREDGIAPRPLDYS
jgi:hypothetical protein